MFTITMMIYNAAGEPIKQVTKTFVNAAEMASFYFRNTKPGKSKKNT